MKHAHLLKTAAAIALPLAVIGSIILAINYVQEQQILRQVANEPQVQLAESIAVQLSAGVPATAFIQGGTAPLEAIQTPFILFADSTGRVVGGNASLGGQLPTLPAGVIGSHKGDGPAGENRITWQPVANVRQALVITPFSVPATATVPAQSGYVIVGRSLRETEVQEHALTIRAMLGWLGAMVAVIVVSLVSAWLLRKKREQN